MTDGLASALEMHESLAPWRPYHVLVEYDVLDRLLDFQWKLSDMNIRTLAEFVTETQSVQSW